jgi:hypothetical protein
MDMIRQWCTLGDDKVAEMYSRYLRCARDVKYVESNHLAPSHIFEGQVSPILSGKNTVYKIS